MLYLCTFSNEDGDLRAIVKKAKGKCHGEEGQEEGQWQMLR